MVIIEIYETPVNVKYKTTLISKASFIVFACSLVTVVLPLILAYKSEGLWLKHDTFYEQPTIKFKGDYLLIATTDEPNKTIICSNLKYYRDFLNKLDDCSIIKAREEDNNNDDVIDSIYFKFEINLSRNRRLSSINLVLPIKYELKSTCLLEMESAIICQQYIQSPIISELSIYADLQLQQSELIQCSGLDKNLVYNVSVIPSTRHFEEYHLDNILKAYTKRSVKTTLNNIVTTFNSREQDTFTLSLAVRYPKQTIYFKPNLLQVIKMAWIQYIAMFVLVAWVMFKLKQLVFRKNWVVYYKVDPLKLRNKE